MTVHTPHAAAPSATALEIQLDAPLPESLKVGAGTAVFVAGTCFAPDATIAELTLLIDGEPQPLMAHGMPRLDLMRATGAPTSYRAGFWGFARIAPRAPGEVLTISVRAELAGGGRRDAELAQIAIAAPEPPLPGAPTVAICMAAFEPPIDLFRRQVDSIRAQTLTDWICVVSDDCSHPDRYEEMRAVLDGDERFVLTRSERRQGFFHNFERALELAPPGARYVALADQDDAWDPDKLETLVREIGPAQLVYSDQRIISADGELIADTYWDARANEHSRMLELVVANSVTGAASLLRRELLADALPFPPAQFTHYHDHWLAVTALALGEIHYVDRPLYDYVQHSQATLGHATATRRTRVKDRVSSLRKGAHERVRLWRLHYFVDACRVLHFATVLQMRCGDRMSGRKRRAIERLIRADRSAAPVPGLFARGGRELMRRRPVTLGAEWVLAYAFGWRRLLALSVRDRPQRALRLDALPPHVLDPRPRARLPGDPDLRAVAEQFAPLRLAVRDAAPERLNVLVSSPDAVSLNLAARFAQRGVRVRIVTTDPPGPRAPVEVPDGVELALGRESAGLEISRADRFVATTWRTAHVARAALGSVGADRFLYLIREYAPLDLPAGTFAALATESYAMPHVALYSSATLREYFRSHGIGVHDDARSAVFEEAIAPVAPPDADELAARDPRRLLFHGGALFELGILALSRAAELGAFARGWTLHAVATGRSGRLDLGGGDWMQLAATGDYARYDVGLALLHAPQPGLVPLEMAAAGMLAVTNTFATKTASALAATSPNLIGADATIETLARAVCRAIEAAGDIEGRLSGSAVRWSRSWDESFDDALLDRVTASLTA